MISAEIAGKKTHLRFAAEGSALQFNQVQAVWYRRWLRNRQHERADLLVGPLSTRNKLHYDIKRHLTLESQRLSSFLFAHLDNIPWLSEPTTSDIDKLRALELAAKAGLRTPATLITSERQDVQKFFSSFNSIITKPVGEVEMFLDGERVHYMYTRELDRAEVDALPQRFATSLFQERVEKAFELRVFYLDGTCDAMAIFSQLDPQTQADFRQYNYARPNRYVPYQLSPQTTEKIRQLMSSLKLGTGSIDLIRTPEKEDVFLEVNPIGQFGMVSKPCNYHLERRVAENLIAKAEHEQR